MIQDQNPCQCFSFFLCNLHELLYVLHLHQCVDLKNVFGSLLLSTEHCEHESSWPQHITQQLLVQHSSPAWHSSCVWHRNLLLEELACLWCVWICSLLPCSVTLPLIPSRWEPMWACQYFLAGTVYSILHDPMGQVCQFLLRILLLCFAVSFRGPAITLFRHKEHIK